jgi:hypothetical protein
VIQFLLKVFKLAVFGHFIMLKHTNIKEVQNQITGAMDISKFFLCIKFSIGIHVKFVWCYFVFCNFKKYYTRLTNFLNLAQINHGKNGMCN